MNYYKPKSLIDKVILSCIFLLTSQLGLLAQTPFYEVHWADTLDPVFTNGGTHLTQTIDTTCSQLAAFVTDPAGSPLPAHKSLVVKPKDANGNFIVDLSGQLRFYVRVRSKDSMRLAFQLRSGTGSASERTALQEVVVPGDTMNWTEITYTVDAGNIGGFDSTDLRDVWLFLDKGVSNFDSAGNKIYFDYFAIGSKPDPVDNSVCPLAPTSNFPYTLHWADTLDPVFTNGGTHLTQTIDPTCSQLAAFVTDPVGSPLPAHKSLVVKPKDANGNFIVDLSGQLRFYVRVRSRDSMRLAFQLRSGTGSASERTALQEVIVPGDTMNWTEITYSIDAGNIGGFDSTDLRDVWLFLDKGVSNFDSAGNKIYFDYFAIGSKPDSIDNSVCPLAPTSNFPYTLHWADTLDPVFTNGGTHLTQTIDPSCSQLAAFVTDPVGSPLPAHKSLVVRPKDANGNFIVDLSGQLRFYVRVRSKDSMRLAFQLRSGTGSASERTALQEVIVPGDTMNWTEITYSIDAGNIGGFDSTDLRDVWLFLDKGVSNFDSAGNKVYFDYFAIGTKPDPVDNSVCPLAPTSNFPYTLHWADTLDGVFTGSGGNLLTQTIDTTCSQLAVSVTDPVGDSLPAFSPMIINPKDDMGNDIIDLTGQTRFYVRVRSRDSVRLGFLARSGDGSSPFRSTLQETIVPGDTMNWTEITFSLNSGNIGGFDSTDLRDIWFYFDRGDINFAGNELYFDYVAIGSKPDPADNSACPLIPVSNFPYTLHWADTLDATFTNGGFQLTQTIDTSCSQLALSVTDPIGDPLPAQKSLVIRPKDANGNFIVDFSGQLHFYARLRSKDSIRLAFQLRSGTGSASERSDLQEVIIPGDLMNWTEVSFSIDASNIGGFDSTDLRDVWLFLDKGDPNFAGDELYFDYFAIGSKPDPVDNSVCPLAPPFNFPYTLHWADTLDATFTNGGFNLTQTIDTSCSQLGLAVTDPIGDPLPAQKSLVIRPKDTNGNFIVDFSNQLRFYARLRSKDSIRLAFQLRSGTGSASERSDLQEVIIPGDLMSWTEVSFSIDASNIGGFDSTDLRDVWLFLDKGDPNFAGDELYFDYFAIGSKPDSVSYSNCVETVGIEELTEIEALKIYPNPSNGHQAIRLAFSAQKQSQLVLRIYDNNGSLVQQEAVRVQPGVQEHLIQPKGWTSGIYTIQLIDQGKVRTVKWVIN